jgi:DNA-binding CsgD family transcriptional regulator
MEPNKPLSRREWEVAELLLQGKSNKLIALALGISDRTVEFHLKNIYTKYQVSSRIELILQLGNTTGRLNPTKPVISTVDSGRRKADNRTGLKVIQSHGQESIMKNIMSRHVAMGIAAAFFTGFIWMALLKRFGHMSNDSIAPWALPILLTLFLQGAAVGWFARRNGNTVLKAAFTTIGGTVAGALTMIPLVGFVVYPLAKLAESIGLINRAAIPTNVTSTLVILLMLLAWLLVGTAVGIAGLFIGFKRPQPAAHQKVLGQGI